MKTSNISLATLSTLLVLGFQANAQFNGEFGVATSVTGAREFQRVRTGPYRENIYGERLYTDQVGVEPYLTGNVPSRIGTNPNDEGYVAGTTVNPTAGNHGSSQGNGTSGRSDDEDNDQVNIGHRSSPPLETTTGASSSSSQPPASNSIGHRTSTSTPTPSGDPAQTGASTATGASTGSGTTGATHPPDVNVIGSTPVDTDPRVGDPGEVLPVGDDGRPQISRTRIQLPTTDGNPNPGSTRGSTASAGARDPNEVGAGLGVGGGLSAAMNNLCRGSAAFTMMRSCMNDPANIAMMGPNGEEEEAVTAMCAEQTNEAHPTYAICSWFDPRIINFAPAWREP